MDDEKENLAIVAMGSKSLTWLAHELHCQRNAWTTAFTGISQCPAQICFIGWIRTTSSALKADKPNRIAAHSKDEEVCADKFRWSLKKFHDRLSACE
jgi:hypothetical protein